MFMVCGEALMDVFSAGDTSEGMSLDARVGGSPFNVAVGLARLECKVALLATVSSDFLGERLVRAMEQEGVDTGTVARVQSPTTLSLVGLDEQGVPSYAFYGDSCADRQLLPRHVPTLPQRVRALHFGSYAMVVDPIASTLRALAREQRGQRLIAYDPNVRTNVEPDLLRWRSTVEEMAGIADLIKVSEEDLSLLYPGTEPRSVAQRWLSLGCTLVVVTCGAQGALALRSTDEVSVPSPATTVVDTVGAGDTFQAALLAALGDSNALDAAALAQMDREQLRNALGFAARAAALTCSRRGADLPRAAELR